MRKLNISLIVALISVFMYSCTSTPSEVSTTKEETAVDQDHQEVETAEPIAFNNNEKWLVNNEMKPFVNKGVDLVDEFIASGKTDYSTLAAQLKEQNKQLITSCTMTGKSHDELHKWLEPHLKLVADLEKATDENEAKELVVKLKSSYALYDQYFQ